MSRCVQLSLSGQTVFPVSFCALFRKLAPYSARSSGMIRAV